MSSNVHREYALVQRAGRWALMRYAFQGAFLSAVECIAEYPSEAAARAAWERLMIERAESAGEREMSERVVSDPRRVIEDLTDELGWRSEWRSGAGAGWHVTLIDQRGDARLRYGYLDLGAADKSERESFGEDVPGGAYAADAGETTWYTDENAMLRAVVAWLADVEGA